MNTTIEPPLTWASGSVVYGRDLDDAWALFRLPTASYDTQPKKERLAVQGDLEQLLTDLRRDGQLVSIARDWDWSEYLKERGRGESPHPELREQYIREQGDIARTIPAAPPLLFAAISLRDPVVRNAAEDLARLGPWHRMREKLSSTARLVSAGLLPEDRREDDQRAAMNLLAQLQQISTLSGAVPASTEDLQWWLRHCWHRGLGEPHVDAGDAPQSVALERNGRSVVRPQELDLLRWTGGITAGADHLIVDSPDGGRAVQIGMVATQVTATAPRTHPKLALAFAPRTWLAWPVDLAISWHWVDNKTSYKKVTGKEKEVRDDAIEASRSEGGANDEELVRPEIAADLVSRLNLGQEPTLECTISAILACPIADPVADPALDAQLVREGVRRAREMASTTRDVFRKSADVSFKVAPLQQLDVFFGQLPGQRIRLPGYRRILMPDQVAAQGWTAAEQVGSSSGWLAGETISQRPVPVRFDPRDGSELNRAPGILVSGDLGAGKTVATSKIMLEMVLDGGIVIDEDPKGDHTWFELLPDDVVQHVRISGEDSRQQGLLDPWLSARQEVRATMAESFLSALLPRNAHPEWTVALQRAIAVVDQRAGDNATNREVLRALRDAGDDHSLAVADSLEAQASYGIARLGFAGDDRTMDLGRRPVTILVTDQLPRPSHRRSRAEYNQAEVVGEQISLLLGHLRSRIMKEHRARLKGNNRDEGWRDLNTEAGREQFNADQRMGRSELVVPIIGTQLATDVAADLSTDAALETVANIFGVHLAFRQVDAAQAAHALLLMGLDPDPRLITRLTELEDGQALMRDHRRRTGWVQWRTAEMQSRSFTTPNVDATRLYKALEEAETDAVYAG